MKIEWIVNKEDVKRVRGFFELHKKNAFVMRRVERNLAGVKPEVTKELVWQQMISCQLTTQQRSGPGSHVSRFISTQPFPLGYLICQTQKDIERYCTMVLSDFGGLRRSSQIGKEIAANLLLLDEGAWSQTMKLLEGLRVEHGPDAEQQAANFINDNFSGFGPKQSRNLLQSLGLTQYEIPIDSRITKWLNDFGFPMRLSATALSDREYYQLVSSGLQSLCEACDIRPCVLDAAIFASFDGDGWTIENAMW